jgi:hypothetical protein
MTSHCAAPITPLNHSSRISQSGEELPRDRDNLRPCATYRLVTTLLESGEQVPSLTASAMWGGSDSINARLKARERQGASMKSMAASTPLPVVPRVLAGVVLPWGEPPAAGGGLDGLRGWTPVRAEVCGGIRWAARQCLLGVSTHVTPPVTTSCARSSPLPNVRSAATGPNCVTGRPTTPARPSEWRLPAATPASFIFG